MRSIHDDRIQCFCLFLLGGMIFTIFLVSASAEYVAPMWQALPYSPTHSSVSAEERTQLAEALADFARSIVGTAPENDTLREKAIALALKLDPDCKSAIIANGQFKHGDYPSSDQPRISVDDLTKMLLLQVKKMLAEKESSDPSFASYLLDFLASINPKNDEVLYQSEMAQRTYAVNWFAVLNLHPNSTGPAVTSNDVTTTSSVPTNRQGTLPGMPIPGTSPYPRQKPGTAPDSDSEATSTTSKTTESSAPDEVTASAVVAGTVQPLSFQKKQSKVNGLVVVTSDGDEMGGKVTEIIATANPLPAKQVSNCNFTIKVGNDMKISKDEAFRAITLRHPEFNTGVNYLISFDDKYTSKSGGSAGTAFAVGLLSIIENVDLDPVFALTGDITVDGKVRKVGGVPMKIRGAQLGGCKYVGIPVDNQTDAGDYMVLNSFRSLVDIQIFSITTLDDAIALARADRPEKIANAMKLFGEVQQSLNGNTALSSPEITAKLDQILTLAPNHLSAKYLRDRTKGQAPTMLTPPTALNEVFRIASPAMGIFHSLTNQDRHNLSYGEYYVVSVRKEVYTAIRDQLSQLEKKVPPQIQNTYYAMMNLMDAVQNFNDQFGSVPHRSAWSRYNTSYATDVSRQGRLQDISKCYDSLVGELIKLDYDKEFVESQLR